ncbi:3-deoxy-D-manno-octulosonic-acid transferase [Pedobacter sp. AK017]|uniref:3-deoxy-D-manno-octulosonic acid transferase n=1 Tax=Pedobacter sp. AK017 TaxID=2723073 RepID=UPI00162286EF|nr:glycosyltransferase N-terminal domain-containing protein [Pedobacter sp. AK017]MBB5440926.1 3-deoxy-D-manno-octulosonic-acid transferase [Pedobacter sp. AK017]
MLWLYNIAIHLYALLIRIFSTFNTKASLFSKGRRNIFARIEEKIAAKDRPVWFHFASLGEFEQGRTVLEKIKEKYPLKKIVVTFFSPSGYEIRKNYTLATGVFYLPLDTASNAKKLIEAFNPELAIFTKYEYWYHYFKELNNKNIPLIIISGIFRPNQIFFKPYGSFHRKILTYVSHFFVQNKQSIQLLKTINIRNATLSGDTRFDRVAENAASAKKLPLVELFCGTANVFIAGSTWPEDEALIAGLCDQHPGWKFIIAPHEIDQSHISAIEKLFPQAVKYSSLTVEGTANGYGQVLIIDNIGMLSALYAYGRIAYIGGGFGAGIHNTLEAVAFGIPVIFGPRYDKFQEAKDLIALGAAKSIDNMAELTAAAETLIRDQEAGKIAKEYVISKTGATDQILNYISRYFKL